MLEYFPIDKNDFEGKVLVTGAGGCIGSWALALLNRAGVPADRFGDSTAKLKDIDI